ncbi:hypothetical protein AAFF_G00220610 [Aldrovandia affinis]|uniref:Uncharacterized protein n=1 Tax=Aldrovandia affinis TaxID=143900 RepID=A0AAD7RFZ4_9TELE|nr:hypothetical protein AAFF_G00220610 [Aldrovandia affinis]
MVPPESCVNQAFVPFPHASSPLGPATSLSSGRDSRPAADAVFQPKPLVCVGVVGTQSAGPCGDIVQRGVSTHLSGSRLADRPLALVAASSRRCETQAAL